MKKNVYIQMFCMIVLFCTFQLNAQSGTVTLAVNHDLDSTSPITSTLQQFLTSKMAAEQRLVNTTAASPEVNAGTNVQSEFNLKELVRI
ncbi:hypothetical protein [Flavobacterium sp.]|uniref:hypothetical protein n=1 Tax=Flavobacterium sp. TaxID=239 RepID=UPI003D6C6F7B